MEGGEMGGQQATTAASATAADSTSGEGYKCTARPHQHPLCRRSTSRVVSARRTLISCQLPAKKTTVSSEAGALADIHSYGGSMLERHALKKTNVCVF